MAHTHRVYDTDGHFHINTDTRLVENVSSVIVNPVQYDHNSECMSFDMERYVDGHDMSTCDRVEIIFTNKGTEGTSKGRYIVDDLQISPDDENLVTFTWLIPQAATLYSGTLSFGVRFICTSEVGVLDYAWNTATYTGLTVSKGSGDASADEIIVYDSLQAGLNAADHSLSVARAALASATAAEASAREVLGSIPDDYTALAGEVEQVSSLLTHVARPYNLYDHRDKIPGKKLTTSTGAITSDATVTMESVPVTAGARYRFSVKSAPAGMWFYDAAGAAIDNVANLRVWQTSIGNHYVDAPENAVTLAWNAPADSAEPYVCLYDDYNCVEADEPGEVIMPVPVETLKGLIDTNSMTDFRHIYGVYNRLDPAAITAGRDWPPANSASRSNSSYYLTDYIPVKAGETLQLLDANMQQKAMRYVKAFDVNRTALGSAYGAESAKEYTVPDGVGYIRVSIVNSTAADSVMLVSEAPGEYLAYGDHRIAYSRLIGVKAAVHAYMPSEVYVAVGRTIELYNNQVCLEADRYHVRWVCDVGAALGRKYTLTATEDMIGEYTLRCDIINDANVVLWTGSTQVKVVAQIAAPKSICPIGDSLTNWKPWLPEVMNLSGGNISFVGTYTHSLADADGETRNFSHEGRSGFSAASYINGDPYTFGGATETEHNRFWNGSAFSWSHYKTTYGINPDAVQIFLGTNKIDYDAAQNAGYIKQMVDAIRADDASIPIFVINTIYRSRQDGYGSVGDDGYATASGASAYQHGEDIKVLNLMTKLRELLGDYEGVHLVPLALCHDTEYNFGMVAAPVNPRAAQTQTMPEESVHPATQGYHQFADVLYSAYCGVLSV